MFTNGSAVYTNSLSELDSSIILTVVHFTKTSSKQSTFKLWEQISVYYALEG